jgi:hypothetical protein
MGLESGVVLILLLQVLSIHISIPNGDTVKWERHYPNRYPSPL